MTVEITRAYEHNDELAVATDAADLLLAAPAPAPQQGGTSER